LEKSIAFNLIELLVGNLTKNSIKSDTLFFQKPYTIENAKKVTQDFLQGKL